MRRENPYLQEARLLLVFIEKGNYEYSKIIEAIDKEVDELQKRMAELERMSEQEFMSMISRNLFGVASKDYHIGNFRKAIENLQRLKRSLDYLLEVYQNDHKWFEWVVTHSYKGKVREMRKAIEKVAANKQTVSLTVFA